MTVLEVADLVQWIEDKFGVSAAPVAVPGLPQPEVVRVATTERRSLRSRFTWLRQGQEKLKSLRPFGKSPELGLKKLKTWSMALRKT